MGEREKEGTVTKLEKRSTGAFIGFLLTATILGASVATDTKTSYGVTAFIFVLVVRQAIESGVTSALTSHEYSRRKDTPDA
jgi:hypothetical protein